MNKNRQSVIRDDSQVFKSTLKDNKDKTKSKIFQINNDDEMKEDIKEDMKEDSFINNENIKDTSVNKKTRKPLMKDVPGFPNELSSQRTDKNLLLKQNISKKSSQKASYNLYNESISCDEKKGKQ